MKLFYHLNETDQDNAVHYCVDIVLGDMIEDGVKIEPATDADAALHAKLEAAMEHIATLPTVEEKESYLMGDEFISKVIYDIATDMAKSAYYMEDAEITIYPSSLKNDKDGEEVEVDIDINASKKGQHSLN